MTPRGIDSIESLGTMEWTYVYTKQSQCKQEVNTKPGFKNMGNLS